MDVTMDIRAIVDPSADPMYTDQCLIGIPRVTGYSIAGKVATIQAHVSGPDQAEETITQLKMVDGIMYQGWKL